MKKIGLFLIMGILLISCGNSKEKNIGVESISNPVSADGVNKQKADKMPVIQFESVTHNFGKVIQGERLSYSFKLKIPDILT